jgi:lipopolysaccharide export LptBFGC system permease protein LptF
MRRPAGAASACGLLLGYYALLFATRTLGLDGTLPPVAAAWLPNLIVALLSTSLFVVASRQPHQPSPSAS